MFLHIGADVVVSMRRVIAILDLKSSRQAEATREFLSWAQTQKRVVDVASGETKSLILTDAEVYLSPISSLTLKKRADFLNNNIAMDLGG